MASPKIKMLALADFVENPNNPQTVTDEDFDRLVEKIRVNPDGLLAHRIAYITDYPAAPGKRVVIAGNKRLRALKQILGEHGKIPADYTQDITSFSQTQRNEFLVSSNVVEGEFDVDRLLADFEMTDLLPLFGQEELARLVDKSQEPETAAPKVVKFTFTFSPDDYAVVCTFLRNYADDYSTAFKIMVLDLSATQNH